MKNITIVSPKRDRKITVQCAISASKISEDDEPKKIVCKALIDTGAMRTCISEGIVEYLGLKPTGTKVALTSANGDVRECDCFTMDIELSPEIKFEYMEIPSLMKGFEIIIGMDILGQGSLTILGDSHPNLYIMNFQLKE